MENVKRGFVYGLTFAFLDVLPMFFLNIPDVLNAVSAAAVNRFAIGFLLPITLFPSKGWLRGLLLGLMLSLPDAIITKAYEPIMLTGIFGGTIIGILEDRMKRK